MAKKRTDGSWRYGELPDTAPLAMAYVPLQKSVSPAYESMEALSRGTLFPGLDLPFMGMVNQTQEVTPLTEMMALCFVAHELALYLDTHQDDAEAFAMYQSFLALKKEARERYVKQCGPVTHEDIAFSNEEGFIISPPFKSKLLKRKGFLPLSALTLNTEG